jgi:signal transduction histidine kinase
MTAAMAVPRAVQAAAAAEANAPCVLVAEDHDAVRASIARVLRRQGFSVVEASTGAAAIELAGRHRPDLAVVDLRLPEVDGFGVVEALKGGADPPSVIVVSGLHDADARVRAFDAGADDFMGKPVHVAELLRRVEAFERTRRALREAKQAREREEHLRLYAAEAAALLAHDLNNGLCTTLSNLTYLRDATNPTGEIADALDAAVRGARRMAVLVSNFVDIGRIEDGALAPRYAPVDVRTEILDAIGVHQAEVAHRGVAIHCRCRSGLDAVLDPSLFERVLHNLLGNAARYVNAGGAIAVAARVDSTGGHDTLVVEVANTGPAVPAALHGELFEKYRRGGDRRSQVGMGLYFCRLAAEAHGGSIALAESREFDVCFAVRVPRRPGPRAYPCGDSASGRMRIQTCSR